MADEKREEDEEKPKEEPKGKSKKLLIIIVVAVLVLGGGGFAAFKMLSGGKTKEAAAEHGGEHGEKGEKDKNALLAVDPFIVNLSDQGRYLKVTMQFELKDAGMQSAVADNIPKLRDAIITLLGSRSAESLSGPEGKIQLKDEILLRANQALGKDLFKNLYFTEFVMQ